jgi:hypothetical protein
MEVNTILIIGNMIISAMTVCQRSRCSQIEISDCLKIRREVPHEEEEPPHYGTEMM